MSYRTARRRWPLWGAAGAVLTVLAVLFAARLVGATMPYNPIFEMTGISSTAPSANANITFRTTLPAGHGIIGTYGLEIPDNSWNVAAHSSQLNGKVAAVGSLTINLDPDGSCTDGDTGSAQNYGPFPLLDVDPGAQGPYATWRGTITDFGDGNPNTNWTVTLNTEQLVNGFTIDGFLTDAILPPGNTVCTPEIFTLTMCGRANPTATATVCGSGSNPVVMTNPTSAGCYFWRLVSLDDSGTMSASYALGVSIGGTACPTPTPSPTPSPPPAPDSDGDGVPDGTDNCPRWPNPSQNLPVWAVPAGDPDCDGFANTVEKPAGTDTLVHCGPNTWPADVTNDNFSDISDVSALTANFALQVPPAPYRYDIAPDPVDGFVDITDVSKMTNFFSLGCTPCSNDLDCDAVLNAADNCPNWPNHAQNLPAWPIAANDPDCDGFSTAVENSAGTNPLVHCGAGDWPADTNNDGFSDITDVSALTVNFALPVPPAPARQDIAPDPVDHFVDITDVSKMTINFALTCY
jgi:Thrombospondin type 3 repeat